MVVQIIPTCNDWRRRLARPVVRQAARLAALALATSLVAACAANGGARSAALQPDDPDSGPIVTESDLGNYLAGRYALAELDVDIAADLLTAAARADSDQVQLLQRALIANVAAGRMNEAAEFSRRLQQANPGDPVSQFVLTAIDLKAGRYAEAAARADRQNRDDQSGMISILTVAWARAGQGQGQQAVAAAQTLASKQNFGGFGLFHLALLNDYLGNAMAADRAYKDVMQQTQGGTPRVIDAYARFLARNNATGDAQVLLMNGMALPGAVTLEADLETLRGGGTLAPLVPTPQAGVAEALFNAATAMERDTGPWGMVYLQLALYLRPDFDVAQLTLASQLESRSRFQEAKAIYEGIERSSPLYEAAQVRAAWCLYELKDYDKASARLKALAASYPKSSSPLVALADQLRSKDRFAEAADIYSQAIDRYDREGGRSWNLYYARGIAYERSKQWPKAEADFVKALELSPDQPEVLNYLGYSWVERGEHLVRAQQMIEKAVELRPRDGYIADSLGWVFYKLGKYNDAVTWLERAVELSPTDPVINDHLGDALWRVGRQTEARFQWSRALNLKPEAEQEPIIRAKLERGLTTDATAVSKAGATNGGG